MHLNTTTMNNQNETPTFSTGHWVVVALYGLTLLYGFGYAIANILLTGSVSVVLMWFLPLSVVMALIAWVYARRGGAFLEIFDETVEKGNIVDRILRWAPLLPIGYLSLMFFFLYPVVNTVTWTGNTIQWHKETVYMIGHDVKNADGSTTRHYLQAGEQYIANATSYTLVKYEVLYGKDDGRPLECMRIQPYSISVGGRTKIEAPLYNIPAEEEVVTRVRRVGVHHEVERETITKYYLWFEKGKEHITLHGRHPNSTLIIARSPYAPDVVVDEIADNIVVCGIEEWVEKHNEVINRYYKALGVQ